MTILSLFLLIAEYRKAPPIHDGIAYVINRENFFYKRSINFLPVVSSKIIDVDTLP